MKFCIDCGSALVEFRVPEGDNLPRHVCVSCGYIHYSNPKIVAGCLLEWEGRVLLCRRAIDPRYGTWTLPAGFMENGETTQAAAARETWEEARAEPVNMQLYNVTNLPHISQVYMMFRGTLKAGRASPGPESLETRLFTEEEIPWDEIAFPVIRETLEIFFEDRRNGTFPVHLGDIWRDEQRRLHILRY
jgi:ADP-ribose pyrophosphatase YjhB (NUDIX family)